MKNIKFPEANIKIAEHQEEFETVHAFADQKEGTILMCFELSEQEKERVKETGHLWVKMLTGGGPMQPIYLSIYHKEMLDTTKEH